MIIAALVFPLASIGGVAAVDISPETGGKAWETRADGVYVRLAQIAPEQARGFYLARGFDPASAERIARTCVFQTILRNEAAEPIDFRLRDWRVETGSGATASLRIDEDWQREWSARAVPSAARTAFRWALFPSVQRYEPGDWNMGMTLYDLPAGTHFDLHVVWYVGARRQQAVVGGLECAKDNDPQNS